MADRASSSFIQWIAWHYLIARKGWHGLSFMTSFSILGVAIGVTALIVVHSPVILTLAPAAKHT